VRQITDPARAAAIELARLVPGLIVAVQTRGVPRAAADGGDVQREVIAVRDRRFELFPAASWALTASVYVSPQLSRRTRYDPERTKARRFPST
jgi:hypothetical protein